MRIRNVKNAKETLLAYPQYVITQPEKYRGKWQSLFPYPQPLHVEIGMGKGRFIREMAKMHPNINYIGIERMDSIVYRALEKQILDPVPNLMLIQVDASTMKELFKRDEISRIYLNFSDPWPKVRHEKRRLTHESFLSQYKHVLNPQGEIHFKTDNRGLFEYSLSSMSRFKMAFYNISLDLHRDEPKDNVRTEYEEKFSPFGPIYRLEAAFQRREDNETTSDL